MQQVQIGLGVILIREGKILLGKRKSEHEEGTWCAPGGHIEYGETWQECAIRETLEETGLHISNVRLASVTNDLFDTGKHYVTIMACADIGDEEPKVMEPDKCERWDWFDWDDLPEPLFLSEINLIKQGFDPRT